MYTLIIKIKIINISKEQNVASSSYSWNPQKNTIVKISQCRCIYVHYRNLHTTHSIIRFQQILLEQLQHNQSQVVLMHYYAWFLQGNFTSYRVKLTVTVKMKFYDII